MNLSELFIRRPVMTVLLNLAIVMAGVIGFRSIPVSALPSYDTPVINVSAALPGASPETMATSVALPLEKQFQTVPGLKTRPTADRVAVSLPASAPGHTMVALVFGLFYTVGLTFFVRRARSAMLMSGLGAMVKSMPWCSPVQIACMPPRSAISQRVMNSS